MAKIRVYELANELKIQSKDVIKFLEEKNIAGMEEELKNHLYYSMKRMRHSIDVDYREYFEEEDPEGKFDI